MLYYTIIHTGTCIKTGFNVIFVHHFVSIYNAGFRWEYFSIFIKSVLPLNCFFQVQPSTHSDMIAMVTDIPIHMKWVVLMSSGGHFAGAIFERYSICFFESTDQSQCEVPSLATLYELPSLGLHNANSLLALKICRKMWFPSLKKRMKHIVLVYNGHPSCKIKNLCKI